MFAADKHLRYWNDEVEMESQYDPCQENHENHECSILEISQLNLKVSHSTHCTIPVYT